MSLQEVLPFHRWQTWLCWLLLTLVIQIHSQVQETFRFTHVLYNGTIPENALGKVYVTTPIKMGIYLLDPPSIHVDFTIVQGDKDGIFHAETIKIEDFCFLRIRTKTGAHGRLNREHKQEYYLKIKGTGSFISGSSLETYTDVNVTVLDQNEFSPLFPLQPYNVSIPENLPLHSSVAVVLASDAEFGINGEIYYSLVEPSLIFTIHPTSGVVSLVRSVSSSQSPYELEIHAEDRGLVSVDRAPSPLSNTKLNITVTPVNRHAPTILVQSHQTLIEHTNLGTSFAVLTVTDKDEGVNGEIHSVSLVDYTKVFRIISTSNVYSIVVTSSLDREEMSEGCNLTVIAVDRGQPSKTSSVVILVHIEDTNDNEPKFEKEVYEAEVLEVLPILSPVLFVKARDDDVGKNAEVEYSIVPGEGSALFSVDKGTGLVSTAALLDREERNQIVLLVRAEDQANNGVRRTGHTKVVITIKDFNDNAPVFKSTDSPSYVSENMPKGTSVTTVTAFDADAGENGYMSFSVTNSHSVPFDIDPFTGVVTTTELLDFETMRKSYSVHVRVSDWGSPFRQESETVLTIKLQDANDNSPEFEKTRCKGYLSRDAAVGTVIVVLTAIDFDAGNIITYSITEGNEDGCMSVVAATGAVQLSCDLSKYIGDSRQVTVIASDGEHLSVPTSISLTLVNNKKSQHLSAADFSVSCQPTDVTQRLQEQLQLSKENNKAEGIDSPANAQSALNNTNVPYFDDSFPVFITVSESAAVGSSLQKISVSDKDVGYNGLVALVISDGNTDGAFAIDTFTGDLKVLSALDYERTSEYNITITAQDLGKPPTSVSKVLRVFIGDENDNAPQFEKGLYEASIFEDIEINSTVVQVFATDKDTGFNAKIHYSILSGGEDFFMEPESGIVKVKDNLDRERKPNYVIILQAEDLGPSKKLSSTTSLTVTISDINDNFPEFVPKIQMVRVREDLPVGTLITTLTAFDLDAGDNGRVVYSLVDGADNKFQLDKFTGTVKIQQRLNFEMTQVYNLSVRAEDGGIPPLESMCLVNIEVVDVNENHYAPDFDDFLAAGSVPENSPIGTYVMTVTAHDRDDPGSSGSRITYSIIDGSGLGRFTIDNNGTIRTSRVFDREATSHFWLTVYAQDGGLVPQFSHIEVLIRIEDVNDNVPQSIEPAYYASVQENSPIIQRVIKVQATDGDRNPNQVLHYAITGGNPQNFFEIDPISGMISTTMRVLDREKQEEHALEVTVSDNGEPQLSSTTRVVIKIIDENDQRPKFLDRVSYEVTVLAQKRTSSDIFVVRVVAFDRDEGPNAEITYGLRLSQDAHFYINNKTGQIFSTRDLLVGQTFDLMVKVSDNGAERLRAQQKVEVTVIAPPRSSTNPPRFKDYGLMEQITESDKPDQLIVLLLAEDADKDKLFFAIEGGNEDKVFIIQPNQGSIFLAEPVDWETRSSYNLTVSVTDGIFKDYTWVYVQVLDVNDNEPVFTHQIYRTNVSESCEVGRHILRVSATDLDKDDRLLYSIASAASTTSLNKFEIGALNGVISVSATLDHEEMSRHLLTIMVRDQGIPSKKSFTRVEIDVWDDNDHVPQFVSKIFEGRVFETASIGTSVLQLVATDQDKGQNSELAFSILSGNVDNTFSMDERMGIISINKQLDRSIQQEFNLIVMVMDHGQPTLSSTAQVHITITLSNNAPPKFLKPEFTTELKENMPSGTVLMAVLAESQSTVVYTIINGDKNDCFMLNPNSGVLSTRKVIDYEQFQFFNLTILATNIVGVTTTAHMFIHITDENDNHPKFHQAIFYGNISESAIPGTMVLSAAGSPLVIQASDLDSGENALLEYNIIGQEAKRYFSIDPNTGAIQTTSSLDHETVAVFNFSVQVRDRGNPRFSAQTPAQVVIYVADVNDVPPHFSAHTYQARVLLPTFHDISVIQVQATDPDTVNDKALTYSIVGGNQGGVFAINPQNGELFVEQTKNILDRYELKIQASDGRFNSMAVVIITVEQSSNSGLVFSKESYAAFVKENVSSTQNLVVVQPVVSALNHHFSFKLLNNRDSFTVGATSGVVQTQGIALDRERRDSYSLVVEVTDSSPEKHVAHVVINISVSDVNDNEPMFVKQPLKTVVSTDAQHGEVIKKVTATDADVGENGEIRYFLPPHLTDNSRDMFVINQYTGDIVVRQLTEKDRNKHFVLTVEAVDRGTPPLSTSVEVPVHVVDKSTPVFENPQIEVSIPENTALHSPVVSIQAVSPKGQKLLYSITSGDRYGDFEVDFNTGLISVVGQLDCESQRQYDLVVRANDVFSASYAEINIRILLEDVNDNAPVFESLHYTNTLSEVARVGTSVLHVSARDEDSDANGLIHYSLAPLSPDSQDIQPFFVNSETGVIFLHRSVDHEEQAEFTFLAVATDSGIPAKSSVALVHVIILDINDNPPEFVLPSFNCYITDQAQRGQLVMKVLATDADDSDIGRLSYSIVGGNEKQAFNIHPTMGLITVSEHRKPDYSPAYLLNVSVTDGVYTSFARVTIGVRNTNHHIPKFTEQIYTVEISEMHPLGMSLQTVTAMDIDRGNYGMLTYTIPSERMAAIFSIDADTGEISTRQVLDREVQSRYELTVAATDNGGQMGFASVHIILKDENDNMPQFLMEEYRANVHFNASIGTRIMQVKVVDEDVGLNSQIQYMIHAGEDPDVGLMFAVDIDTGIISVKSSLTFAANRVFQFFVRARDQGIPSLENHVPVEILVIGQKDVPPFFPGDQQSFFIQEDEPAGGIIATVRAQSGMPLTYFIIPGMTPSSNNPPVLSINNLGQIRILRPLDRETTPVYTLALRAQSQTSPPLVAHLDVQIQLRDINDNAPEFESDPYTATVVEDAQIGSPIIQVKAVDKDLPRKLTYSFGVGMEELANIFAVDPTTGQITLLTRLDREKQDEYKLIISVKDTDDDTRMSGRGVQLTASTTVIIMVTDYNDNEPEFARSDFTSAVNEGALPGTVLLKLISTDADFGLNADVTYYIVGGDLLGQFQIHSNGELFVNKALDRERRGQYQLSIAATDGGFVTYTKVIVTVLDDNDNAPVCEKPFLHIVENEDIQPGKPIAQIKATDKDESSGVNARIQFSLEGQGMEKFIMEKDSGLIRTASTLDRETKQEYFLVATARDGGGLSCTTEVRISLRDVNDNPPEFTGNFQQMLTVQEDARINTLLTRVTTVDKDAGFNRNTKYRIEENGPSIFSIDSRSGILSVVSSLDREQKSEYNITIVAYNEISPELSATATLHVIVLDVNDNPPNFERTSYYAAVSEAAEIGAFVIRVRATSLDVGDNAAITYSIAAGNQQGKFSIGPDDGIVKVAEPLDHELSREYFLTVQAQDHGTPPLTNTAIISINITDVNDNTPLFSQPSYVAVVNELASLGTEVFKVLATDADSYRNSRITYSIIDGNSAGHFLIGPQDGVIHVSAPLDRETADRHSLTIHARDSGQPILFSTAIVNIVVEDANDNPPRFQNSSYTAQVQRVYFTEEGRRTGIEIMKFVVIDLDTPSNGPPFTFDIVAGNRDGEFHVDSGGLLTTAGKLSKQVKEKYELTIRVFDSGNPPLNSDVNVTVQVVDDSLFPPEIRNLSILISSCMDTFSGGVIGQMEARDRDPYDALVFNIVSPNRHLFDVHREDGRLIALTGLDEGEYVVNISVTDRKFTRYGQVLITVVCMSKEIIDNGITIQFANMIPEQFFASYKKDFQRIVKQNLDVRLSDVEIINVQPSAETIQASNRPKRSSAENDLDVLFAVRRSPDRYFNKKSLKRKVQKFVNELENGLAVRIVRIFSDVCTRTTCETGTCIGSVVLDDKNLVPVVVNGESFVSARHYYTHQCVCLGADCQSVCGDTVCPVYEVCGKDIFGDPSCQCPEGHNGPQCENIIPLCSGNMCPVERPMTFSGKSYAKWTLSYTTQKHMSLSLKIRTRQSSAVLMYAKGQVDYSILAIEDGSLVYRFNCGSGEGQVWVPVDLSDGQWHFISVERKGRLAEINLDGAYTAMGQAPGVHEVLNLDLEEVYFGAKVDILRNGYRDISRGFEGCMEDIRMFKVSLPLSGSNDIAHSQEFELVEFHCKDSNPKIAQGSNACSSSPCLNGGVCQFSGHNSYICVCLGRYKGTKCELDSDPCQDSPCFNQGQCKIDTEAPNTFTCRCPGDLLGMRCTYGHNCRPNPCQHGGTCIEGPTSALCHCAPGFAGLYCDKTINVCESSPCKNGGICQALAGGTFRCNCTSSYISRYCEDVDPSTSGLKPSGGLSNVIYGIIGAVAGVFLIFLILFVFWRVRNQRRRKRNRSNLMRGIHGDGSELVPNCMMKEFDFKRKVSNPDISVPVRNIPSQPPPVPNRPASYTPSTHASLSTLNNLDSVRNYGSAADELETTGLLQRIPDFTEYLASFSSHPNSNSANVAHSLTPPLPSNHASDSESIQKAPWEFEYPNILGNYEAADNKKHRDNLAKRMPGLHSPLINSRLLGRSAAVDASSISSLPVSESEDDLNGYHWDTSDWAPRPSLPNISEIPANEIADSSSSSPPSYDSNDRVPSAAAATASAVDVMTHCAMSFQDTDYMEDSEYVGDSEYAENEYDFEDRDDLPPSYTDLPSYEQLLAVRDMNESYELPKNLTVHPDHYLPSYHSRYDQDSLLDGVQTEDGNLSDEQNADVDAAVAQSVAERTARQPPGRVFLSPGYVTSGDYTTDVEPPSRTSYIDDMSMSVCGYTSNASCSDISGLCEIDDSEINASEDDSEDDDDEHSPCLPSHLHTQV